MFQTQEDANRDFEKCVVNLSASTTKDIFKRQKSEQERVITNLSGIEKRYDTLSNRVDNYKKEVSDVVKDYTKEIEGIKKTQKDANDLNNHTTTNIDTYLGNLQQIFDNITKYFK